MPSSARLTEGSLAVRTFRLGLPLSVGMACHGLFNCVDLVIVGRLGAGAIAAVTIAGLVNMATMMLFNGIANMIAAVSARLWGAERRAESEELAASSLRLTLVASVVLGVRF